MNSIWKKVVAVAKRCLGAISMGMKQVVCFMSSKSRVMVCYFFDDSPYFTHGPSAADCAVGNRVEQALCFGSKSIKIAVVPAQAETQEDSDAFYPISLGSRLCGNGSSKPFATTQQRRILRPQGWAARTRLQQPSWLSVLGMPAIFYILEYEKYGLLRFSAPLFVLIIRSYLL
ncbi:MAG: hypothetical protein JSS50_03575 [Proteobacteria bacterium]|nr:hypothetical protein [Pseudomonadota bacterium]